MDREENSKEAAGRGRRAGEGERRDATNGHIVGGLGGGPVSRSVRDVRGEGAFKRTPWKGSSHEAAKRSSAFGTEDETVWGTAGSRGGGAQGWVGLSAKREEL